MRLTQVLLYKNTTPTDSILQTAGLQTYSYLYSMFWRASVHLFAGPLGSSISQHPWLSPLNIVDYRDRDQGFDLRTTPLNHKKEAGIFSKGCLCAPIPQEDWAKSSMKVSELQSKTLLPRVQKQILHQSLCCFAEKQWWWKIYKCVMSSTCSYSTWCTTSHIICTVW